LTQIVDFHDLYNKLLKVKPVDLLGEKRTSKAAEELFEEHLQEVLSRFGGGGVPIDLFLIEAMESVRRYCQLLDSYSRVYSYGEREISGNSAELAIENLDTKMSLTTVCRSVNDSVNKGHPM